MPQTSVYAPGRPSAEPVMLTVLRGARGWTQKELAGVSGVSQSALSKAEAGLAPLSGERLSAVADAFDAPVELLTNPIPPEGLQVSCVFHRRRTSKVTAAAGRRVDAIGHLTRLSVEGLASGVHRPTELLRRIGIEDAESPDLVARIVRQESGLPAGPVADLMALMDELGVVVVLRHIGTTGQDAFSTWPPDGLPLMVVNSRFPVDRMRWTVAHELGHIVMHVLPNDAQEEQANRFASELLMPAEDIADDLAGLTTRQFTRLTELKAKWRVSVAALIQRAATLGTISDRQFKEFRIRMAQMGWVTAEPVRLSPERPVLLGRIIEARRTQLGEDDTGLARAALMRVEPFRRVYLASGRHRLDETSGRTA